MLEILCENILSEVIPERSEEKDLIVEYQKEKFRWAGHVTRFIDNMWTRVVVE